MLASQAGSRLLLRPACTLLSRVCRGFAGVVVSLALLWLTATPGAGQSSIPWSGLDEILRSASLAAGTDIELIVLHQDAVVYRNRTQFFDPQDLLPIASASKWLSAATILSLVDEGLLDLDDPAGLYLFYFRNDKAGITLRHLLTHTSGLGGDIECLFEPRRSLDECAIEIANSPLLFSPGQAFHYNDASLHVAGRLAEIAGNRSWNDLFQQRIAIPLGMTRTTFLPEAPTANPQVSAGAQSTADDYLRFLRMLRNRGVFEGRRILSERAVSLMLADQTGGAGIRFTPYAASESWKAGASANRYGLGNWIEGMEDGLPDANSSQGGLGVSPYFDARRDLIFLAFLRDDRGTFQRDYYRIQQFLNEAFPLPGPPSPLGVTAERFEEGDGLPPWLQYTAAPCTAPDARCPLLLVIPPEGGDPATFAASAGLSHLAGRERLVVALPLVQGADGDSLSRRDGIVALAAHLAQEPRVDAQRIYLAGFREGGVLAEQAACRQSETFAGLVVIRPPAPAAGHGAFESPVLPCEPRAPMAVMVYDPREPAVALGAAEATQGPEFWAVRNRCLGFNAPRSLLPAPLTTTDGVACEPGAPVRVLRTGISSSGWPPDAWDFAVPFLRAHRRAVLLPGRAVATSAAHYWRRLSAPGALVSLFGIDLAPGLAFAASTPLPGTLGRVRVQFRDARGVTRNAPLVMVSPLQINLVVPDDMQPGPVSIFVYRDTDLTHRDWMELEPVAPALFSANATGEGPPAGEILYEQPDGTRRREFLARMAESELPSPAPIELGAGGTAVFVTLYGTGWRHAAASGDLVVEIGGVPVEPLFAGAQGQFEGLDQINLRLDGLPLPAGEQPIRVQVAGQVSATLRVLVAGLP